jgi:hypothetical protein
VHARARERLVRCYSEESQPAGGAFGIGANCRYASSSSSGACWIMYTCVARELVQPDERPGC